MQQTTYNLKRIEPDDPFSPDTLNANTDAVAAQLARVDAALAAESAARETAVATEKSAREASAAAEITRVNAAVAAKAPQTEITRLESAAATEKARVNGEISRIDTALAAKAEKTVLTAEETARKSEIARLEAAMVKFDFGSYIGSSGAVIRKINVKFTPKLVYVGFGYTGSLYQYAGTYYGAVALQGVPAAYESVPYLEIVAGGFQVYGIGTNNSGTTYRWFALG